MSTALVEETPAVRETEERELVLDAVTRQRLEVARCAVDTLEQLADTGAWDRLDPAIAAHLADHARRLIGFLGRVRYLPAVRECERELLAVRRIERRLEVCLDLLVEDETEGPADAPRSPRKRARSGGDELFFGDFTNKTLTEEQRELVKERRRKKKESRQILSPRAKRIALYVVGCFVLTVSSLVLVAMSDLQSSSMQPAKSPPVKEPAAVSEYTEDLRVFLPAKLVVEQGDTAVVMVRREWLLKSQEQRQVDADGAHVFLQNRAIRRMELFWEDGGLIGQAEHEEPFVFREGTAGISSRPVSEASDEAAQAPPPDLAPPGRER